MAKLMEKTEPKPSIHTWSSDFVAPTYDPVPCNAIQSGFLLYHTLTQTQHTDMTDRPDSDTHTQTQHQST
jgi:hypothetical protein